MHYRLGSIAILATLAAVSLACGGFPVTEPAQVTAAEPLAKVPVPVQVPARASGESRIEVLWGPPSEGDVVWVEGKRMSYDPALGAEGLWWANVGPGSYALRLRDGLNGRTHQHTRDVKVKPGEKALCESIWIEDLQDSDDFSEPTGVYDLDRCRMSRWPATMEG
jgi:hypothetical protein